MSGHGTDPIVVAKKSGNSDGAKGWNQHAEDYVNRQRKEHDTSAKSFEIPKQLVMEAFQSVKANKGAAGVDGQEIADFEVNLKDNLYKLWNRMSSGSYFPAAVRGVAIPKKSGGNRILGIPTVTDRIAQTVVTKVLEPILEKGFHPDSYGYRPGRSAHDALATTRKRCWQYDWVLEFDIRGLFDNILHELLLKALRHHTDCKWILLYVERWLTAPLMMRDGDLQTREKGTPQGGVASPVLANLFMHYVFDLWMRREFPENPICRYADDGLVHCHSREEAERIFAALTQRLNACGLEIHPVKSRIVYCRDSNRRGGGEHVQFTFLGYTFRSRTSKAKKTGELFQSFQPGISRDSLKRIREIVKRQWKLRLRVDLSLVEIATWINPVVRGWIAYFGVFSPQALRPIARCLNGALRRWAMRKYRKLFGHKVRTRRWLTRIWKARPDLFAHWKIDGLC